MTGTPIVEKMVTDNAVAEEQAKLRMADFRAAVDTAYAEEQDAKRVKKEVDDAKEALTVHLARMETADGRMMNCLRESTFTHYGTKGEKTAVFSAEKLDKYFWKDEFSPLLNADSGVAYEWQFARILVRVIAQVTALQFGYSGVKGRLAFREYARKNQIGIKVEPAPMKITPGVSALATAIAKYI